MIRYIFLCNCCSELLFILHCPLYRGFLQKFTQSDKTVLAGFEVLTAIVMKIATFWDIAPCSPCSVENQLSKKPARAGG
jgi:hypothetical protein